MVSTARPDVYVIAQARMGSTRLPGKVMKELAGRTVLEHVMERCRRIGGVAGVICATATTPDCDVIAELCARRGLACFRGSEEDVLARYYHAAKEVGADVVIRVTCDNPLISPQAAEMVLRALLESGAAYACNDMPPSWPHGLNVEAFPFEILERMHEEARRPEEREHVSPWIRERAEAMGYVNVPCPAGDFSRLRLTLDTPEDWAFLTALADAWPGELVEAEWRDILAFYRQRPELFHHNA